MLVEYVNTNEKSKNKYIYAKYFLQLSQLFFIFIIIELNSLAYRFVSRQNC